MRKIVFRDLKTKEEINPQNFWEKIKGAYCDNQDCPYNNFKYVITKKHSFQYCENCFANLSEVEELNRKYEGEFYKDKIKRHHLSKEWFFLPTAETKIIIDDIDCMFPETCWYQGNLDRLQEYDGSYVMKGTDHQIRICNICWGNNMYENDEVALELKKLYITEDEKKGQIKKYCKTSFNKELETEKFNKYIGNRVNWSYGNYSYNNCFFKNYFEKASEYYDSRKVYNPNFMKNKPHPHKCSEASYSLNYYQIQYCHIRYVYLCDRCILAVASERKVSSGTNEQSLRCKIVDLKMKEILENIVMNILDF